MHSFEDPEPALNHSRSLPGDIVELDEDSPKIVNLALLQLPVMLVMY